MQPHRLSAEILLVAAFAMPAVGGAGARAPRLDKVGVVPLTSEGPCPSG